MTDFQQEYASYCDIHGVPDRIDAMICDVNSILRGKWLPADGWKKLMNNGLRLPRSLYGANLLGHDVAAAGLAVGTGDPDGIARAVPGTMRYVPWLEGNVAQVLVCIDGADGNPHFLDSRQILARTLDRLSKYDLSAQVATELEFYFIRKRTENSQRPEPPSHLPPAHPLDMDVCARYEAVLRDVMLAAEIQEIPTDTLSAEVGPGQFEINFNHTSDVLAAADHAVMFRRLVRAVAAKHDLEATFMARPYATSPGSGMHVHMSLQNEDGHNILSGIGEKLSLNMRHSIGGMLSTMNEFLAIFAPNMNSYRRLLRQTCAPSSLSWGIDDRGAAIRLPEVEGEGARIEHRLCGADVNPYLAIAAIIGGAIHGMNKSIEPLSMRSVTSSGSKLRLTQNWLDAVREFESSDLASEVFGSEFRQSYCAIRYDEIDLLMSPISVMEYSTLLGRI